jgi:electron transport complex protein RnfA
MAPALVFFIALSLNLLLNFAFGIREMISRERAPAFNLYYPWIILFLVTALLWVFFAVILRPLRDVLDYVLVFPLAVLGGLTLEKVLFHVFPALGENQGVFKIGSSYNGLSAASLVLTLRLALNFWEALLLSFAFAAGGLLAYLIIKEIQKRSFLEAIPYGLRGTPLLLISMGILSLVFSAASVLLLKIFL